MSTGLAPSNSTQTAPAPAAESKRSGGPRSAEGKENSRRNALKRGLRSKIVFPDDLVDIIENRYRDFAAEFVPRSTYEEVLIREMAAASAKFERCISISVADLVCSATRAEHCWERDRRKSVEVYAMRLSRDPSRIARGLSRTRQGADWLIGRWQALAAIAVETGCWDDSQRGLAHDLLGVPLELRTGTYRVPDGEDAPALIALAESEILSLREEQEEILDDLDDADRAMAMAGMPIEEDKATARLRRDEARARKDFDKARDELFRYRNSRTGYAPMPLADRQAAATVVEPSPCPVEIEEPRDAAAIQPPANAEKPSRPNRRARKEQARRDRGRASGTP